MDAFSIIDLKKRGWHIRTKNTNSTKKKNKRGKKIGFISIPVATWGRRRRGKKAMSSSVLADMYNSDEDAKGGGAGGGFNDI